MFGAEWRYVWVSYKACRPVQWTWDMRFASLEISNVIKNIQQDLEVFKKCAGESLLPSWYSCQIDCNESILAQSYNLSNIYCFSK